MIRRNFYKKLRTKRVGFIACTIAGIVALFSISYNIGESIYVKNNVQTEKTVFKIAQDDPVSIDSEIIIYDNLEKMSNEIMSAMVKNENSTGVTKEKIDAIREIVTRMGYGDKGYLFSVLDRWEKENFSYVTDEHNYFYLRLKDYAEGSK